MNKLFIMRLTIHLFTAIACFSSLVSSKETYLYEKQNFFGMGARFIPKPEKIILAMESGAVHPKPLPVEKKVMGLPSPYKTLYQGLRKNNDTRVFLRRFDFEAKMKGHHVLCEGMFDCIITFLAVESTEAIPIIMRGGAGYKHFTAVVKAKPGRELKGQVRAYCKFSNEEEKRIYLRTEHRSKYGEQKNNYTME